MSSGLLRLTDKAANPVTTASLTGADFTGRVTFQFGVALTPVSGVLTLGVDGNSFHVGGAAQNITSIANITGSGPFFCVMDVAHIFIHAVGILETNTGANITATVGSRFRFDQDADGVTWLVTQEGARSSAIITPQITSPISGETGVNAPIVSSAFTTSANYYGTHQSTDWEIASDSAFVNVADSSLNDTVNLTSYSAVGLTVNTLYYVRVRYRSDRFISNWSVPIDYTTIAFFINPPTIAITGAPNSVGKQPTIGGGVFAVTGSTDTQTSADWVIKNIGGTVIHSSMADTANLVNYIVPGGVILLNTQYIFEVTYHGTSITSSGTSITSITTPSKFLFGRRGVFGGGFDEAAVLTVSTIEYINIGILGNAINFGSLSVSRDLLSSTSDSSRGVFSGGSTLPASGIAIGSSTIDYIAIGTLGNAINFGSLIQINISAAATSDGSRGIFAGGTGTGVITDTIEYITIGTLGNAINFGILSLARGGFDAVSDGSRGIFAGGYLATAATYSDVIDYVTIGTLGNAINFGVLSGPKYGLAAASDGSRGIFAGGFYIMPVTNMSVRYSTIEYITIGTLGNAINFGSLSVGNLDLSATSDGSRGIFAGGNAPGLATANIEYVSIGILGNAVNFGALSIPNTASSATSGA